MEEKHAEETQELVRQHQVQRDKLVAQQEEQKAFCWFQHQQSLLETKEQQLPGKQREGQTESGEEEQHEEYNVSISVHCFVCCSM